MTDTASLVLKVDSTSVDRGAKSLDELAQAGAKAEAAAAKSLGNWAKVGATAGLALVAAGGAFVAMTKNAINAADAMNDLHLKTGLAFKELAAFDLLARQSGTSLEGVAQGFKFLSGAMVEHADKLRTIGVTSKDTNIAMGQFADAVAGIQDPALKTKLAMEVLGRAGVDLLPMLAGGAAAFEQARQQTEAYGAALEKVAPKADQFNDGIARMETGAKVIGLTLADQMLPALLAVSDALLESSVNGKMIENWGGTGAAVLKGMAVAALNVAYVLQQVGDSIGGAAAQFAIMAEKGLFSRDARAQISAIGDAMNAKAKAARTELDKTTQSIMDAAPPTAAMAEEQKKLNKELDAAARKFVMGKEAADKIAEAYEKTRKNAADFIAALDKEIALYGKSEAQKKEYEAAQIAVTLRAGDERKAFEAAAKARTDAIATQIAAVEADEKRIAAIDDINARLNAQKMAESDAADVIEKAARQLDEQTFALTHNADEMREHNIVMMLQQSGLDKTSDGYIELEKRIRAASGAFADAKHAADVADAAKKSADQAAKEWERASEQIAQSLTDNIMRGGKSAGELLEDYFRTLVLRPIIQGTVQMGLNAVGLGSTNGFGGMLQTGSSLLDLGSLGTMTSYGTAAATGGLLGGASQGAMLAAQTAEFGIAGATATAEAMGGIASSLGALSAALGPIAIGVGALSLLGAFDQGVPKTEAMGGDISVKGDWSTTNLDAGYTVTADAFKQQFASTLSAFGADAADVLFSFMTSSDPSGGSNDFGMASGTVNGQAFGLSPQDYAAGTAAANIPELMARSLIAAFKTVDMGPVANAIVVAAGDASTMSDELLAQTNAALAGAAALFGTTSPLQAAMESARSTALSLSTQLQAVGVAGDVSGQSIISAVNALDLTTTAGQQAASAMLALQPAVSAYETQLLGVFGFTADSLQQSFLDAVTNSPDAATAGATFAADIVGGIQNAMLGDLANQVTSIVTSGIIQPALNALIAGQSVSEALSDANIKAVIDKATATAAAFGAIWNDPVFQAAMDSIQASIGNATSAALAYVPAALYQQPDTTATTADTSAAQNALDLAAQMADVAYQMSTLSLDDLSKSLADAAKSTQDAVDSATALGAAQDQLDQILALGSAQAAKLVGDAQMALFQPLADAAATLGMDDMTAATYAAQKAYADTVAQIDEFVIASDGLADPLQVAAAYANALAVETNALAQIQKEYADSVVSAQAAISDATQSAWNDQVAVVTQIQNWIDQITGLSKNIDARIFDIRYAAEGADQVAMLREKEAAQWAEFNSYQARANDESVAHQIDLAGQIADTITERYRVETKAIEDTTKSIDGLAGFAKKLKDYANDLKIGSLSPLGLVEKTVEAGRQVSELLAVLRNPASSLTDVESARADITGAITKSLTLSQQSSATAADYGRAYAKAQAELASLGDDALTEAERQTVALKNIAVSTEDTVAELRSVQTLVDSWLPGMNDYLADQVTALAALQVELDVLGVDLVDAINGLPNAIAALLGSAVVTSVGGSGRISNPAPSLTTEPSIDSVMNYAAMSGDALGAVQMAQSYGISSAEVAAAMGGGVTAADVSAWAVAQGLPSFATGVNAGILPADTILQAHGGERITPATYVDKERSARDKTNELLARLLAENETMRVEMGGIKKEMEGTQRNTKRHADLFENVTEGGDAMRSNVVESVAVPVA